MATDHLSKSGVVAPRPCSTADLASAQEALGAVEATVTRVPQMVVFLDYDGTLTPIVARPELAILTEATRTTLARLAEVATVAIISGRGLEDVRSLVDVGGLFYAGSHGLEIAGPDNTRSLIERGSECVPMVDEVEKTLRDHLADLDGLLFERKRLSLAVHFRLAPPEAEPAVSAAVAASISGHVGLRRSEGKKVIEVRPDIDWDKGKAVEWLLEQLGVDPCVSLVMYIGDDITDEDAFRALKGRGVGIVVRDQAPRETYADLALDGTEEVHKFLNRLVEMHRRGPAERPAIP